MAEPERGSDPHYMWPMNFDQGERVIEELARIRSMVNLIGWVVFAGVALAFVGAVLLMAGANSGG